MLMLLSPVSRQILCYWSIAPQFVITTEIDMVEYPTFEIQGLFWFVKHLFGRLSLLLLRFTVSSLSVPEVVLW